MLGSARPASESPGLLEAALGSSEIRNLPETGGVSSARTWEISRQVGLRRGMNRDDPLPEVRTP
jgi:hypothetical protein